MSIYSYFKDKNVMEANGCFCTLNLPEASESDMVGGKLPPYAPVVKYLVDDYECPSNWIKSKGTLSSYFCPVLENKGLWLDFNKNKENEYDVAILISCQGINPITGLPFEDKLEQYEEKCPKCKKYFEANRFCKSCGYKWPKQNYVCTTGTPDGQLWFDGFRTVEGVIRQYVLTEEKSKGVAANIIGENRVYAIGISFYYSKSPKIKRTKEKTVTRKPSEYYPDINFKVGNSFYQDFLVTNNSTNAIKKTKKILRGTTEDSSNSSDQIVGKSQLFSPVLTISDWNVPDNPQTSLASIKWEEQIGTAVANTYALQEVPKTLEIGAGKEIDQQVHDDPMKLDYWRKEIQARICINYLHENLVKEILKTKKEKQTKIKMGSLKGFLLQYKENKMPKENYTHITVTMDRSGSMGSIASDMQGGLESFIEDQKGVEGEATFSFYRFDNEIDNVYDFANLDEVTDLALQPRGATALLDAMGLAITETRSKILELESEERPSKVICITITDGHENSSREYSRDRIMGMVQELQSEDEENPEPDENGIYWEFVFMGANQDAIAEGGNVGIRRNAAYTYQASGQGATMAFQSLSRGMTSYRTNESMTMCFTEEDRQTQNVDLNASQQEENNNMGEKSPLREYLRDAIDSQIDVVNNNK